MVNLKDVTYQQLPNIIEFLPDAIFAIDCDNKVIAWNQALEEMTGMRKEHIIGKGDYAYAIPLYGEPRPILIDLLNSENKKFRQKYSSIERKGKSLLTV